MYAYKFPREDWGEARKVSRSLTKAMKHVESIFSPGYTREPYIQLIKITRHEYRVIAEWMPSKKRWISPLKAAGFE